MRKLDFRCSPSLPLPGILTMSVNSLPAAMPVDGRQSQTALAIARGTARYLHALGYCVVSELPLPSGRRADLVALGGDAQIHDAVVRPRRRAAAAIPRRSERALWGCNLI